MKKRLTAAVTEQIELAPGIWDLYLKIPEAAKEAAAGQFVNLYCHDSAHLLPRPISLAGVDKEGGICVWSIVSAVPEPDLSHSSSLGIRSI